MLTGWFVVVVPLRADILDNDLTLVYIGVRIGLEHGWTHIYSLPLQHELFAQLRPHADFNDGERFVSPPPFAWLVLPLTVFGAAAAVYAWLAISIGALVAAWSMAAPGRMPVRALWLLGALAWYPVLYSLSLAQPDLVILLLVAAAWRLAEANKPYVAGAVLGLSVIKPQLTLLLPLVLLFAGRWKIAAGWAAVAAVLAAASFAVVGGQGLNDYLSLLSEAQHVTNNRYFTLAYVLGPGLGGYVAQGAVVAAAAVGAYANRSAGHSRVFALGLVATTIGATYWHLQDFAMLVLAAWLVWRRSGASRLLPTSGEEAPPAWQRWLLLAVAVAAELAWPLTPLPLLVAVLVWFVCLLVPSRPRAQSVAE
ncbi:MAG TPA: glycosyltransferase family 87 protein [Candidatus Limnocylindrales bacterium]|nr:glycosyltransferase family 87 protein [Candidatus Limnocylindrales bacterium]